MRSSGNRLLTPAEIIRLPWKSIFRIFRDHSLNEVYDFEKDVALAEALEKCEPTQLPPDFMLLQPASHHPDVWTDIARMRSLNGSQAARNRDKHLCPLPFDIVERSIVQRSQPGEIIYDPFLGLGTTVYCAIKLGRVGRGAELSPQYFKDVVHYANAATLERATPSLFDLIAESEPAPEPEPD